MKQLMFMGVGNLEWHEVPEPRIKEPQEALVRPIAVARCDLDSAFFRHPVGKVLKVGLASHLIAPEVCGIAGDPPYAAPIPIGHECVAEVIELGCNVTSVQIGQRVIVPFQIACGECACCQRGMTSRCRAGSSPVSTYGFGPGAHEYGGVMTDVVRVPYADAMLVPLPDNVDPVAVASASDNLPDAYRSVAEPLAELPGASVLIVGGNAKSVGLYAASIAKALGAGTVDYCDINEERLEIAGRLGVGVVRRKKSSWLGAYPTLTQKYQISVDASSDPGARGLELALRSLEPGGTCTSVSLYPRKRTPIPLLQMYIDGVTLRTGITNARPLIPKVLALVAEGRLDPSIVTTLQVPWDEAAVGLLARTTKVVVTR